VKEPVKTGGKVMLFAISAPYIFLDSKMGVELESAAIDQEHSQLAPLQRTILSARRGSCFITEARITQPTGREF
jgi:hypothetical protein